MNFQEAKDYLLSKPEAVEDYPFGSDVLVPKIKGKMFATLSMSQGLGNMNLKCDPNHTHELRDLFKSVIPGYHMNKKHWNTIILDGTVPKGEIERMIDHSYSLVVLKLKKSERESLELSYGKKAIHKA